MRNVFFTLLVCLLVSATAAAPVPDLGSDAQRQEGKELYDKYCSQCHGLNGDAVAYATDRVKPRPRDFTSGNYKFRTTPNGMLPTDEDIARVIKVGLPYTSMPGWPMFSDPQIQNIVYHLKTFSSDFEDPEKLSDPIDIPEAPATTEESITRGRAVYEAQGCAACHGDQGRGDGLSAPTLSDDLGNHLRPADMTMPWTYRGGSTKQDIFRTFSTGLNGTPMPSYGDTLAVEDRWDLVNYIYSLSDSEEPNYAELLNVIYVDDALDFEQAETLFQNAPTARFPLFGQIIQPGRNFYPSTTSILVQAVHNKREIAFRLRWNDMRAETAGSNHPTMEVPLWADPVPAEGGDGGDDEGDFWGDEVEEEGDEGDFWGDEVAEEDDGGDDFWGDDDDADAVGGDYSDAVAIQFPTQKPTGIRKPYFLNGDTQGAIDQWFIDLAKAGLPQQVTGRGTDALERTEGDDIIVESSYEAGQWTVLIRREMRSGTAVSFNMTEFSPVSFSVWDGFNEERGNKRALSAWFHLYVEPDQVISPAAPMIRAALFVLLAEILLIVLIRRKYLNAKSKASSGQLPGGREVTA